MSFIHDFRSFSETNEFLQGVLTTISECGAGDRDLILSDHERVLKELLCDIGKRGNFLQKLSGFERAADHFLWEISAILVEISASKNWFLQEGASWRKTVSFNAAAGRSWLCLQDDFESITDATWCMVANRDSVVPNADEIVARPGAISGMTMIRRGGVVVPLNRPSNDELTRVAFDRFFFLVFAFCTLSAVSSKLASF